MNYSVKFTNQLGDIHYINNIKHIDRPRISISTKKIENANGEFLYKHLSDIEVLPVDINVPEYTSVFHEFITKLPSGNMRHIPSINVHVKNEKGEDVEKWELGNCWLEEIQLDIGDIFNGSCPARLVVIPSKALWDYPIQEEKEI